ncbi:hypothetical protein B0H12DRAFT_297181 [Mycena haematopus]|nr:hypothetical protein B0H12DRAFT_297181 [Mycena haematopus]
MLMNKLKRTTRVWVVGLGGLMVRLPPSRLRIRHPIRAYVYNARLTWYNCVIGSSWDGLDAWHAVFDVNLFGVVNAQQVFLPVSFHLFLWFIIRCSEGPSRGRSPSDVSFLLFFFPCVCLGPGQVQSL